MLWKFFGGSRTVIAYIDSSVVLRKLLGEPNPLVEWEIIERAYTSQVLEVEVHRVLDRYRLDGTLTDEEILELHRQFRQVMRSIGVVDLTDAILVRASKPFPTVVSTLDAIHLVTALEITKTKQAPLAMATHDAQLARASKAVGLEVVGVSLSSS